MFSIDWKDVAVGLLFFVVVADILLAAFMPDRKMVLSELSGSIDSENGMIIIGSSIIAFIVAYAIAKRSKGVIEGFKKSD